MASLFRKVLKSGGEQRPHSPPPLTPPSPDLSHLTAEELSILSEVLQRQQQFEHQEQERIRCLEAEMVAAEQAVKGSQPERSKKWRPTNSKLCRLCFKTWMSNGSGRTCSLCRKRVCGRCGSYHHLGISAEKVVWLCRLCLMKREVSYRTGEWYHGTRGTAYQEDSQLCSSAADMLRRKMKDLNLDSASSDQQTTSGENRCENDCSHIPTYHLSDCRQSPGPWEEQGRCQQAQHGASRLTARRRSLPLGGVMSPALRKFTQDHDEEDENIQDILQERKLSYRRRQQKKWRKRSTLNGPSGKEDSAERLEQSDIVNQVEMKNRYTLAGSTPQTQSTNTGTVPCQNCSSSAVEASERKPGHDKSAVISSSSSSLTQTVYFGISRSVDRQFAGSPSDNTDATGCSILLKTASTRRRAFQQSSGSGSNKQSTPFQENTLSDVEILCPHSRQSCCKEPLFLSPNDGCEPPRASHQNLLSGPDDHRLSSIVNNQKEQISRVSSQNLLSGPDDHRLSSTVNNQNEQIRRTSSPGSTTKSSIGSTNPPKMRKSRSVSPGDKTKVSSKDCGSPSSSRKTSVSSSSCSSRAVAGTQEVPAANKASLSSGATQGVKKRPLKAIPEPPATRGSKKVDLVTSSVAPRGYSLSADCKDRPPLSAYTKKAKTLDDASLYSSIKSQEKRQCGDGLVGDRHKHSECALKTSDSPIRSLKLRVCRGRSYSEGNEREDDREEDDKIRKDMLTPPRLSTTPQSSRERANYLDTMSLQSPQRRRRGIARDLQRHQTPTTLSEPYSCATHALRRVKSPDADIEPRDAIVCRCISGEGWVRRSSFPRLNQGERQGSVSPNDLLRMSGQTDSDAHLVHTVLHKPPNSYPEAFGVLVTGGVSDCNGSLTTLISDVTVGSPAQLAALQPGDQVVEWNGQPLAGATFEQVLAVFCETLMDTLHLFTLPKEFVGRSTSPVRCSSRQSDVENPAVTPPSPGNSTSDSTPSSTTHKRRMLPRTPIEIGRESRQMCGELLLSIDYDPSKAILYVTLVMARDLALPKSVPGIEHRESETLAAERRSSHRSQQHPESTLEIEPANDFSPAKKGAMRGPPHVTVVKAEPSYSSSGLEGAELDDGDSTVPCPFVLVHLLPDRKTRGSHKTEHRLHNRKPKWEQTFVYDNFTITELVTRSLELTMWSCGESGLDDFLGEVLLELREWHRYNQATWCRLHDHDDNSPPLPRPPQLSTNDSVISSASSSCYDDLSRSPDQRDGVRLDSQQYSPTPGHPDTFGSMLSRVTRGVVRSRLVSRVSSSFSHADRKVDAASDESSAGDVDRRRSVSETQICLPDDRISVGIQRGLSTTYNMDLLAPPSPMSRANSSSSFFLSDDSSDGDPYSPIAITPDRPAPDGDDITSILGPGQVPPRPSSETQVCGDVKLGFAVSKGQLEVDVICVRGLQCAESPLPPDTYVKTYLVESLKTIQKKKSQVVKASLDPIFRRKIKYSACNVHGRHMKIVVWEKPRNFERKRSLGETVIRLDALDLSVHSSNWYKLFPVNSTDDIGSTDSLNHW